MIVLCVALGSGSVGHFRLERDAATGAVNASDLPRGRQRYSSVNALIEATALDCRLLSVKLGSMLALPGSSAAAEPVYLPSAHQSAQNRVVRTRQVVGLPSTDNGVLHDIHLNAGDGMVQSGHHGIASYEEIEDEHTARLEWLNRGSREGRQSDRGGGSKSGDLEKSQPSCLLDQVPLAERVALLDELYELPNSNDV